MCVDSADEEMQSNINNKWRKDAKAASDVWGKVRLDIKLPRRRM